MPPSNQPNQQPIGVLPTPPSGPGPKPPRERSWARMLRRANRLSTVLIMLFVVMAAGGIGGYFFAKKPRTANTTTTATPQVTSLSKDELKQLSQVGTSLGDSGQTLNIGAAALFRGKVDVGGDLSVGGRFNANGPVTLSQLNITGTTALTGLNVGSNLNVGGIATLQKGANVTGLLAVNGGLNVSGTVAAGAVNATSVSTSTLTLTGPLTVAHLRTQGPVPSVTAGSAVGGGGTASISGNDTAGTVNVGTGSGTAGGILATVTFRAAFSGTPHVVLTPLTGASAATPVYVTRTATGFVIRTDSPAPSGATMAFDYIVTQ